MSIAVVQIRSSRYNPRRNGSNLLQSIRIEKHVVRVSDKICLQDYRWIDHDGLAHRYFSEMRKPTGTCTPTIHP
jgi:hypothetical protein